jgi:hypothetical protein
VRGFDVVSADTLRSRLLSWSEASRNLYSGNFNSIQNRVNIAAVLNNALQAIDALSLPSMRSGYHSDVDAHAMEHDKPDAAFNYCRTKGYVPLCSFVRHLPDQVEMRSGIPAPGYDITDHVLKTVT